MDYAEIIDNLQSDLLDLNEKVGVIQKTADAEQRELSEEESSEVDEILALFEKKEEEIERRRKAQSQAERLQESFGRKTDPEGPKEPEARKAPARPKAEDHGKWGFRHFGEFAMAVKGGCMPNSRPDPRLIQNAPTTYGNEDVGEEGGFAVPPDFRQEIMEKVMGEGSLLERTDRLTAARNTITFPADETTPWQSSGGVLAYWTGEGSQLTQSKPDLSEKQVRLHKLTALVPMTDEVMEDSGTLRGYLSRKVPQKFDFKIQEALVNGSGSGQPVGILNSDALISVAKDTTISPIQQADTVIFNNIVEMYSRMYAPCRSRAIWLINQDIEPQLHKMAFDPNNETKVPVYLPPGGASAGPYGTLMGRPVVPIESCSTLGDKGDIIFADLTQYLTVTKTTGIRQDMSIHLFFDYDMPAFRFIFRLGGMPWWASAIDRANGTNTLSCFVTLDERD